MRNKKKIWACSSWLYHFYFNITIFLHQTGSNNTSGINRNLDKIPFHPFFTFKDLIGFIIIWTLLIILTLTNPYLLGDPNIQLEWYFLFAYAILRSFHNKLGTVIALVISSLILIVLPPITIFFNSRNSISYYQ